MKRIALLLALFSPFALAAPSEEEMDQFCSVLATFAANVAVARDRGVPYAEAAKLTERSQDPKTGSMLGKVIKEVYDSFLTPTDTRRSYYDGCVQPPRPSTSAHL